jgi:hypothetical protein
VNEFKIRRLISGGLITNYFCASRCRHCLYNCSPSWEKEYIPFSKVQGVIEAARRTGIGIFPWISDFIADLSELDAAGTHSLKEFEERFGGNYITRLLQRYWIHMGGRALETYRPYLAQKSVREICNADSGGCAAELLNTRHFHLDLFGNYIPGLCSGLSIKREDLARAISADRYPVLTTLFHDGIRGILKMAQAQFDYTPAKDRYISKCDLCTEIRTFFVKNDFGGSAELNPKEFYHHK